MVSADKQDVTDGLSIYERAINWLLSEDTGRSSKAIISVTMRTPTLELDTPRDFEDFGRCYRLLKLIPELRERLQMMTSANSAWGPIVQDWDCLEELYRMGLKEKYYLSELNDYLWNGDVEKFRKKWLDGRW